jgi:hypothetical protein
VNGGGYQALPSSKVIGGLQNGSSYTVQIRACNTYCGPASSASGAAVPYGPLAPPTISAQRTSDHNVRFSMALPGSQGNGRPVSSFEYRVNNGGWQGVPANGTVNLGSTWDESFTVDTRYSVSGPNETSAVASASGSTAPEPPPPPPDPLNPRMKIEKGTQRDCQSGGTGCWTMVMTWFDMTPGQNLTIGFRSDGACGFSRSGYSVNVNSVNGSQLLSRGDPPPHLGNCNGTMYVTGAPAGVATPGTPWN